MESSSKFIYFLKSNTSRNQRKPKKTRNQNKPRKKKNILDPWKTRNDMIKKKKKKEMLKQQKEHLLARRDDNRSTFQSKPFSCGKANALCWSSHNYHSPFKPLSTDNLATHLPSLISLSFANYKTRQAWETMLSFL